MVSWHQILNETVFMKHRNGNILLMRSKIIPCGNLCQENFSLCHLQKSAPFLIDFQFRGALLFFDFCDSYYVKIAVGFVEVTVAKEAWESLSFG
jgi:hypothetical protein